MKRRLISLLLTFSLVFSIFTSSFTITASAGFGAAVKSFGMNKVIDFGYRSIAKITNKALNATGDITGVEQINKVASIINTVLMGSTGKVLGEIKSLCNDILSEINNMHADMEASFSVVEQMLGQQAASNARNKQDEKWNSDVMNVINEYNAEPALEQYMDYMKAAVEYSDDKTNTVAKEKYEQEQEKLIQTFRLMYPGEINVDVLSDPDKLQDLLFTSTAIDDSFINMINKLSANFVKGQNSSNITLAETAAMTANEYFPFSHQQYQFIHTVVGEQLMETAVCMLVASEFFDIQGEYILEKYGEGSSKHTGYLNVVNQYYDMITNGSNSVENRINEMLDTKMVIDMYTSKSLMDYMRPEDAVSVNMHIEDFEDKHRYSSELVPFLYVNKKYINDKVKFNRVMVNNAIYYIIDKEQFSDKLALSTSALEYKDDVEHNNDVHVPSTDYLNLIKNMSDGANIFKVSGKDASVYDDLIATNSFALAGNVPVKYLEGYFPDDGTGDSFIITSENEYESITPSIFHTKYAKYEVIDAKASHSTGTLKTYETSAEYLQPPQGDNQRYSVILSQQSENYQQNLRLETNANALGIESAQLVTADNAGNKVTINPNETKKVDSGKNLAINIKLDDTCTVKSIKCIRDNDLFSSSGTSESYIIESTEEFSTINPNEDGSYTINYSVPYSDAKIVIETEEKNVCVYENGFCPVCGAYQPATLNSNGVYEIGNAGQFFWYAYLVNGDSTHADFDKQNKSANAVLTADIDLNGREWTPIGNYSNGNSLEYKGRFNGQNHTISGVKITKKGDHLGIFGKIVGTTVENFTVKGDITLNQQGTSVGGAVGKASSATISNVSSYVNISMKGGNYVGGIVGYSTDKSSIKKCCNAGNVSGSSYIGGVVGSLYGTIENCYNTGTISGGYSVGGILGIVETNGLSSSTVKYCHNVGTISCGNKAGGIVGLPGLNTASNCYYLDSCGAADKYGTSKTAEQFSSGEIAYLLNNYVTSGKQIWYQNIDNGKTPDAYPVFDGGTVYYGYKCNNEGKVYSNYPLSSSPTGHKFDSNGFCTVCGAYQPATLNSDGVYEISNAGQLYWFASLVNGDRTHADFESQNGAANAILVKDIVVNDGDISKLASAQSNSLRKWSPIGTSDNSYTGQFDGRNHTISGIYFSDPTADNVGLFGYTRGGADIYNVGIVNSYIEGKNCVGGILGRNNNSGVNIQHCFSEATVIGNEGVGGIEGSTYGGKIINCYNAGSVTGSKFVGSIRGRNTNSSGAMNNCFNVGEVIGTGTDNIGGIRGDGNGTISNCYCISNQLTDAAATTKTPEQFASGEVAYLLNNSVTDGKQVWYQNIDNDKTPDDYPRFDGGTVYYLEYKDAYSNTYSEKPAEPDAFDKDDDGNLIISTYGDLVKLSELIRSDYEVYGSQNYILTNNIKASDDSEWSQGIGSVEDNKPFNGTFNGKGYCIVGLNVNSPKYGGLFEIIGENGKVKDLFVYDCDFKSSSGTSGGIAAINNGTIDHCISGINLTSGIIHINSDITIDAVALNSSVKGELSGGIAGENNGLITGSRNAAVVTGAQCGGIAAENNGKIYGCANSVKIGASSSSVSGGLVGRNGGIIESSYNSGTVSGNSEKTTGSIAGINGYDGAENPTVKNVFYTTVNNLNAVGTDSLTKPDETNKVKSKNSDFQSDDFVNELNSVSDDTVTWVRKSKFNKGNPTIKGNFFMYNVISAENGINIEGSMHEALNIQYNVCTEKDEEYKAITSALDKTSVSDVYSVSLTDNDGNYIPAELWCQGDYKISVPVSGNNVEFAAIDTDGQINYYKPDSVENGIAVFTVSHPMSFAVVDRTSTNKNISDIKSTDKAVINTSNDNTTIQTGSTVCCSVLLIVMFASAFVIIFKRRNNFE